MDEAKKKELERLRSQIDPEVLKRVAAAMGEDPSAAMVGSGGGGGAATSAPSKSAPPPSGGSSGSLSDLKARIRRREKELDSEKKSVKDEKIPAYFIVYDNSHFRARQFVGFLQRAGFNNISAASEPQEFVKSLIVVANNANVEQKVIVVAIDAYNGLMDLMNTEAMKQVKDKLPGLANTPIFTMINADSAVDLPPSVDKNMVLNMRHDPLVGGAHIRKVLGLPDPQ